MRVLQVLIVFLLCLFIAAQPVDAAGKYGIHILNPAELAEAKQLLSGSEGQLADEWQYVVIPLSLEDTKKPHVWESFFATAQELQLIPIIRLVTEFNGVSWSIPDRQEVIQLLDFISQFEWHSEERYVIIFNEVNHAAEWGGTISPESYVAVLKFASHWARTQDPPLKVLPAAMDLAAPNGTTTLDAFAYIRAMYAADPDMFSYIDAWNSHSYPNPGFVAPPTYMGRNGLHGFEYEQELISQYVDEDFPFFITETGWRETWLTRRHLPAYYLHAAWHIWSDDSVKLVAPFVLRGAPGPFAEFSFLDESGEPSLQYEAYQQAIDSLSF